MSGEHSGNDVVVTSLFKVEFLEEPSVGLVDLFLDMANPHEELW